MGTERGPRILDSIMPVVDEAAQMSKGTSWSPVDSIRHQLYNNNS